MTSVDPKVNMPTKLNRLFQLYAMRKKVSAENLRPSSSEDKESMKKKPSPGATKKPAKNPRRA
jgi:hypothetical protein